MGIIDHNKQLEKIKLIRSGKFREGLRLGIPQIDEHFRFKFTNFNVILGHANVGKTTVILYLMLLYSLRHKIKWLVFSSENEPYALIRKLIEYIAIDPINKIDEDNLEIYSNFIYEHFRFVDNNELYTYKDLMNIARSVKQQWKYQGFMIDPYNSLVKEVKDNNFNGHEYDYKATSELRIFCREHNVTIWLNTHANTEALRKRHGMNHAYANHPIPPMASDVEGGGKFVNRADDFMVIHRYIQHPKDWMFTHLHIRKIKDVDTGGRPTSIDDPIQFKSIRNNVGFEINHINPIKDKEEFQVKKLPF